MTRADRKHMTLKEAAEEFAGGRACRLLDEALADRKATRIRLTSLGGSSPAMALASQSGRKTLSLVVADDMDQAGYIYHDLVQIAGDNAVAIFPAPARPS